jgi:hypothetical protein
VASIVSVGLRQRGLLRPRPDVAVGGPAGHGSPRAWRGGTINVRSLSTSKVLDGLATRAPVLYRRAACGV